MALAAMAVATASFATLPYAGAKPVRVLIDRSHEWMFAYDDLSERM